jgi:hypothetical protein
MADPTESVKSPEARARGPHPVRGHVLIVGPDGAGKTAVADRVAAELTGRGVAVHRANPRPGAVRPIDAGAATVTEPHRHAARGRLVSIGKCGLLFADFVVGAFGPWRRARRDGVLLVERGWHDMVVDPRRYRMHEDAMPLLRALGRLLPRADVAVVLTGRADVLYARKREVALEEVGRQLRAWPDVARRAGREVLVLDTERTTADECAAAVLAALGSQ